MSGVLADRYASTEMREIWSQENKIILERELWIAVMKAQSRLGFDIPEKVIASYENVKGKIDLDSINVRERILKHDVAARIEEFNALAGHQSIHIGMTSRDLTENVELQQIRKSLELIELKSLFFLHRLGLAIKSHMDTPIMARTHNVPAQVTTLGKRFATWAEELMFAIRHLQELKNRLPLRGIKGAVGTQQDISDVIGADLVFFDSEIAQVVGFQRQAVTSSQIYPRSHDYEVLSCLVQISAASTTMATNIRLMSGFGLMNEGFRSNQVGSSAMPHKVNARSSERINGLGVVLKGLTSMISEISGDQWNDGDVSCSVVRRVALPNSFYAIDAILDTSIDVIVHLKVNKLKIDSELKEHLPFMLSSKILMKAVEQGIGREEAHKIIKGYALAAANHLDESGTSNFFDLVCQDQQLKIPREFLESLLMHPLNQSGHAQEQSRNILREIESMCAERVEIFSYNPQEPI